MKQTILFYTKGYNNPIGGAQSASNKIIHKFISNFEYKYNFIIVSDSNSKNAFNNELIFKHRSIKIPIIDFIFDLYFSKIVLNHVINRYKPNIVHIHGYAGFYPSVKTKNSILTLHDIPSMKILNLNKFNLMKFFEFIWYDLGRKIRLASINSFGYIHALSNNVKKDLLQINYEMPCIIIPNGIENKVNTEIKIELKKRRSIYILMVGNIEYRKGIHLVAEALKFLPSQYKLLLAGNVSFINRSYFQDFYNSKNRNRIFFLGYLSKKEMEKAYEISSIFISASLFEACQLSPLESLNYNIPIIATNNGYVPEILKFCSQFRIKKGDPETIANKIIEITNKKEINIKLNGIFNWDEIVTKLDEFYQSILS
jgi:glycosyltransferase involved in cell wall biosynthesis